MTKESFFKKYKHDYDKYYVYYICPANRYLSDNKPGGHKECKRNKINYKTCPYSSRFTERKMHEKIFFYHIQEEYIESSENYNHTLEKQKIYDFYIEKETIERSFGSKKDSLFSATHNTDEYEYRLTFACINLKKLAKISDIRSKQNSRYKSLLLFNHNKHRLYLIFTLDQT